MSVTFVNLFISVVIYMVGFFFSVCRRWQMLVHGMFTKVTRLEIAPGNLGLFGPITSNIISKLLILSGPTLKSLKLQSIDYSTRRNILKIVGKYYLHLLVAV